VAAKGTYDVAFYLDGYKTVARQISIYPGNVIDIDDRMESGPSVRPEDLATKTHERRDEASERGAGAGTPVRGPRRGRRLA